MVATSTSMAVAHTAAYRRFLLASLPPVALLGLALRATALVALAVAGFVLLLLAWRAARRPLFGLSIRREVYPSAFEDDVIPVSLVLENRARNAVHLVEVGDSFGPAMAERQALLEPGPLQGRRRRRLTYRTACSRSWGVRSVGPLRLSTSDPMGFFRAESRFPEFLPFAVFPRVYPVTGLARLGARPTLTPQEVAASLAGQSLNYLGVRDYRPGDDFRRIHWPATARRGSPSVKECEVDLIPYFTLLLDLDRAHRAGTGLKSTLEYLVRIAASLVWSAVRRGDQVQILGEGARALFVPPGGGELHLTYALYELIRAQQDGCTPLLDLVDHYRPQIPARSTVAILGGTIFLDPARLEVVLASFESRAVRPVVLLINKDSFLPIDRLAAPRDQASEAARTIESLLRSRGVPGAILSAEQELGAELSRPDLFEWSA